MGVIFNTILAIVMFMLIFGVGKKLPPPVVGGIEPGSPAAKAGLVEGDEIIEIAGGKSYLDFSDIAMAAALSGRNQKVAMKVRHNDGSDGQYEIAAEQDGDMRQFGIMQTGTLVVTDKLPREDADELFKQTALKPGDKIVAVNGTPVQAYWQFYQIVSNTFAPKITLLAERISDVNGVKQTKLIEGTAHLVVSTSSKQTASKKGKNNKDLGNFYTLVPRLKILDDKDLGQYENWFKKGDVIVKIADVNDPNYGQFVDAINKYEDKDMPVEVLRAGTNGIDKIVRLDVIPRYNRSLRKVILGVSMGSDLDRPVAAETVGIKGGPKGLEISKGATVTSVNGQKVSSFYDILEIAYRNTGKDLQFDWTKGTENGTAVLLEQDWKAIKPVRSFIVDVPFEPVVRLYKAENIIQAVQMGYHKTWSFIMMSYVSIRRLAEGLVGSNELMGPVGIATISYRIVSSYSIQDFLYLLALLSACIAALNIVPMLPFDGGLALFLLIEKIKGSPVSEKIQNTFLNAGWVLVGGLFLYVTFNDVLRLF